MTPNLEAALRALRDGQPVLLYDADGREEETDIVIASQCATPELIRQLRTDGGGLLCTAIGPAQHTLLDLPWLSDLLADAAQAHPVLAGMMPDDIQYDASKPAFGLTINHRSTFTGITDADRANTIQELARFFDQHAAGTPAAARQAFGKEFRAPGHVILLNGAPNGLADRQGHTELSLELLQQAGMVPCSTICEMMGADGNALSRADAEAYAAAKGLVFLTGADVLESWQANLAAAQ